MPLDITSNAGDTGRKRKETSRERFKRIALDRVGAAEKAIDQLKQFANAAVYDMHPLEKERMVNVIRKKADELEYTLKTGKPPASLEFVEDDG